MQESEQRRVRKKTERKPRNDPLIMAVGGITLRVPRLDFGYCVKFIYKGDILERPKVNFLITKR